jgi:hypothetical protein
MTPMVLSEQLRIFDFHGLRLGLSATDALATALDARFARFPHAPFGSCDLLFDYRSIGAQEHPTAARPTADARVIYESAMGQVLYDEHTDRLSISSVWPIHADCDPRAGHTVISVQGSLDEHLWALAHALLTIPLIETLKRRGRFSVHAAGVALAGKALLIPGSSGSGKSTLALALARAGFDFLGDDMTFLARDGGALRALAFPEAFDLTDDTLRLFPELADLRGAQKLPGWPKHQLRVEDRFGARIAWSCRPTALVFPRVSGRAHSQLTTIERDEALLEILPNILLSEATSSQQHLDVLGELVASCACYRLETGTDFTEVATLLRGVLER